MKKVIWRNGLIGGAIVALTMTISMVLMKDDPDFENGMLIGYTGMLIAFSFVFVGIRKYRDHYNDGMISFSKAVRIGLLISLVASTVYVVTWLIEYYFFIPDFMDRYTEHTLAQMRAGGMEEQLYNTKAAEMEVWRERYKNPLWVIVLTYAEILWVGVLVTLLSAAILMKKERPLEAA